MPPQHHGSKALPHATRTSNRADRSQRQHVRQAANALPQLKKMIGGRAQYSTPHRPRQIARIRPKPSHNQVATIPKRRTVRPPRSAVPWHPPRAFPSRQPLQFWAVGPSALPCAGAAPPQRPPPKPGLTPPAPVSSPPSPTAPLRRPKEARTFPAPLRVPRGQKVLPLQFFAALSGKKKLPLPLPFSVALRVLRGQNVLPLPLQFFAVLRGPSWKKEVAVAVLRGPPCPPWTKGVAVAVAVLRGPSWPFVEKRSCRCSCRSPWHSVSSVDKTCCRCSCSSPWTLVDKNTKSTGNLALCPITVVLSAP